MPAAPNNQQSQPISEVGKTVAEPAPIKLEPEKVIFSWKEQARPFKRRGREFWIRASSVAMISGFIVYIVEGLMPVLLIVAIVFLYYILSTVEPEKIEYAITNKGIKMADKTTPMELMKRFWFGERLGSHLLILEMEAFPGRLELVVNAKDKDKIKKALSKYILEEELPSSNLEKTASWFSNKFPEN